MKTLLLFFSLACLLACSKDDDKVDPDKYYIHADIGTKQLRWEGVRDHYGEVRGSTYTSYNGQKVFTFTSTMGEHEWLAITTTPGFLGKPGEFDCGIASYRQSRFVEFAASTIDGPEYKSPNGKVIFTKADDSVVEGTFYFDVYSDKGKGNEKIEVRNGKFRIPY